MDFSTSKAKLLPSADLDATHGLQYAHQPFSPTQPWMSNLNASVTENLYDNGDTLTNIRIARLNRDAATLTSIKSRDSLCLSVASEFYRYSLARKLIEVKSQQRQLVQKQFNSVNSQFEQGFKTKKDYLRFHAQVQRSELDYRNAMNTAEKSATTLKMLMGAPTTAFSGGEEVAFTPVDPKTLDLTPPAARPAIENTYESRIAKLQTDVTPLQSNLVERKIWPQLSLTSGLAYNNSNYLGPNAYFSANENYYFNVLLQVKFNLWDWGIRRRDLETAHAKERIQENQWRQVTLSTSSDIRNLLLQLDLLKGNYEIAKDLLAAEEQSFGFVKRDYDEGKNTAYDLILELNDFLDARVQFYTAQYDLATNLAQYHYYLGDLYAKLSLP